MATITLEKRGVPFFDIGDGFEDVPGTSAYSARNQSGLITQLLVCASTGLLCFLVFCFLRPRPSWSVIFAPRMNMKRHKPPELPNSFFGWIIPLIKIDHQEVMDKVGLDAVVILQFITMAIKLFGVCSFFGVVTLVPISVTTGNATHANVTGQLDELAITVLEDGSNYLIAYLCFTYFFCFLTFFFLHRNFRSFLDLRARYLLRMRKTLSSRTVVVTGIPHPLRTDDALAEYYSHLNIGAVNNAHIVRHLHHLNSLLRKRARALQKLETAYTQYWGNPCKVPGYDPDQILNHLSMTNNSDPIQFMEQESAMAASLLTKKLPKIRTGFMGLWGKQVNAIQYYTEQFNDLDQKVLEARESSTFEMTNVGFVTFKHMASALIASQIAIHPEPFNCRTVMTFEPRDVLWSNIAVRGRERLVRELFVWAVTILLSFFWIAPISAFSTLTSLDALERVFPQLVAAADDSVFLQNILQGLLPTIAVNVFMAVLPLIFDALGIIQGLRSRSAIAEATFSKYFFFLLFNVLLVFTIASTITKTLEQLWNHPAAVANLLGTTLPAVAPFFINYTVLQGMLLMPLSLLLFGALIIRGYSHVFLCKTPRDYASNRAPWAFNYGTGYPPLLLIFIIVLEYSSISPIILLFGTIYFCIAYVVYKYQLLYVYFQPFDAVGGAWTMVFPRIILGMILFQLTMTGIFVLKSFFTLAALCVPLIVFTVLFKLGMDAAFDRNSKHLPMQILRDKTDQLPGGGGNSSGMTSDDDDDTYDTSDENDSSSSSDDDEESEAARERWKKATRMASQMVSSPSSSRKRHVRRVILDEDDYAAIPDRYTDYRQPPMELNPGVLDTGLKAYANPALIGILPQLWLPVKAGEVGATAVPAASKRFSRRHYASHVVVAKDLMQLLKRAESVKRRTTNNDHHQEPKRGLLSRLFPWKPVATASTTPTTMQSIDAATSSFAKIGNMEKAGTSQEHILRPSSTDGKQDNRSSHGSSSCSPEIT